METLYRTIYNSKYFIELNIDKSTQYVALWTHKRHPIPRPFGIVLYRVSTVFIHENVYENVCKMAVILSMRRWDKELCLYVHIIQFFISNTVTKPNVCIFYGEYNIQYFFLIIEYFFLNIPMKLKWHTIETAQWCIWCWRLSCRWQLSICTD